MDVMALLPYIALGMKYGPTIISLFQSATSNADLISKIATLPADVMKVVQAIGTQLFPNVKPELQAVAGATAAFDHAFVMWVQQACNMLLPAAPKLVVDGLYGPRTQANVKLLQQSLGMAVIDGWVGKLTRAAIDHAVALVTSGVSPSGAVASAATAKPVSVSLTDAAATAAKL